MTTRPRSTSSRTRFGSMWRMRARECIESTRIPAWPPERLIASTPAACSAMTRRALVCSSPVLTSTSSSRASGCSVISFARASSSSVVSPIAETTATMRSPPSARSLILAATFLIRLASPTEEPPNFCTTSLMTRDRIEWWLWVQVLPRASALSFHGRPVDLRRAQRSAGGIASFVGQVHHSNEACVTARGSQQRVRFNGVELELRSPEHLELPGVGDHAPREVDEPNAALPLDVRATEVPAFAVLEDLALKAPACRRRVSGHQLDDVASALDADVNVVVSRSAGSTWKVPADDLYLHPSSLSMLASVAPSRPI